MNQNQNVSPTPHTKREFIIQEIIQTEDQYCKDLSIVIEVNINDFEVAFCPDTFQSIFVFSFFSLQTFLKPIRNQDTLSKDEISAIFSNVEAIAPVNQKVLQVRMLSARLSIWIFISVSTNIQSLKENLNYDTIDVGKIFLDNILMFKLYAIYCKVIPELDDRIKSYKKQHPKFEAFLKVKIFAPFHPTSQIRFFGLKDQRNCTRMQKFIDNRLFDRTNATHL